MVTQHDPATEWYRRNIGAILWIHCLQQDASGRARGQGKGQGPLAKDLCENLQWDIWMDGLWYIWIYTIMLEWNILEYIGPHESKRFDWSILWYVLHGNLVVIFTLSWCLMMDEHWWQLIRIDDRRWLVLDDWCCVLGSGLFGSKESDGPKLIKPDASML